MCRLLLVDVGGAQNFWGITTSGRTVQCDKAECSSEASNHPILYSDIRRFL